MACAEAATSSEEPFDVSIDARWLSDQLVARSRELNVALPNRLNISLGGCTECGLEALTNDIGLVACVQSATPGYQLWAGGSLGTAPRLGILLRPFLPREHLWAAVWSIVDWYVTEGDVEQVAKGRLKFVVEAKGEAGVPAGVHEALRRAPRGVRRCTPPPIALPASEDAVRVAGARADARVARRHPSRATCRGCASITVRVPLGDLLADDLDAVASVAPEGRIVLTRGQNILVPSVPVERRVARRRARWPTSASVPTVLAVAVDVRACPGLTFCSLAITGSQPVALAIEQALNVRADLPRDVSIAVSGCPNSCTKQQVADIGLSGTKVKVDGVVGPGYQLYLGADLPRGLLSASRCSACVEHEVPAASDRGRRAVGGAATTGRDHRRSTFRRAGLDLVAEAIAVRLREYGFGDRPLADEALAGVA